MQKKNYSKLLLQLLLLVFVFNIVLPISVSHAGPSDTILSALTASTVPVQSNSQTTVFEKLFSFLFDRLLKPILNLAGNTSSSSPSNVVVTPLPSPSNTTVPSGKNLQGKVIVLDPGHGGSNPGAVQNNSRESDNNLAVALKLRSKLVNEGAKVIMTRETDRTVAAEGSSLKEELQERVTIAENNHADIFVSIHTNQNPNSSIAGAMTFYHSGKSPKLAQSIQQALIYETQAVDKGIAPATFYVVRNTSMPSVLIEMGFISNQKEAALLQSDSYRNKLAQGIFSGITNYFKN